MKSFFFQKSRRLLTNNQFKAILARKVRASDRLLTVFVAENMLGHPRLGVSVGKFFRSAILRNRLKRLIREAFRLNQHKIPQGFDYLVMLSPQFLKSAELSQPKKIVKNLTLGQLENSFLKLIDRIRQENPERVKYNNGGR